MDVIDMLEKYNETRRWVVLSQRTWHSQMVVAESYDNETAARWHLDKLKLLARDGCIYDCGMRIERG